MAEMDNDRGQELARMIMLGYPADTPEYPIQRQFAEITDYTKTIAERRAASRPEIIGRDSLDRPIYEPAKILCVNASRGIEWWFCSHYAGKITPGTEKLNDNGECVTCGKVSVWDGLSEAPSFLTPDSEL